MNIHSFIGSKNMLPRTLLCLCVLLASQLHAGQPAAPAPSETKTGAFNLKFKERSPFSAKTEMDKRMVYFRAPDYDLSAEDFEVYVPASYKPGAKPYGLLVFINSGDDGKVQGNYKPLMDKYNLIWVGANKGGNERTPMHRVGMALDAVHNLQKMYNIDAERIYLSGTSGGGRASSGVAPAYPDVFSGAIYLIGCNPMQAKVPPHLVDKQKRLNSYAFVTGSKDFNKPGTNDVQRQYKSLKFERTEYFEVPDMGHEMPPTSWLEKALLYVEEPLSAASKAMIVQAQDLEKREKFGQALVLYRKAAARDNTNVAQGKIESLTKNRDDILANAKKLIEEKKGTEALPSLDKLLRQYESEAGEVRELMRQARK
jgi:hypothetical protein